MGVDAESGIHYLFHRFQSQRGVDYGSDQGGHVAHEVGVGEHAVTQSGRFLAVLDACRLDYVANLHVGRAHYLTSLAIKTVFKCLVIEEGLLKPVALTVGAGLLRTREIGIDRRYGTIDRADGTLYTLLEVIVAYIAFLIVNCRIVHSVIGLKCYQQPSLKSSAQLLRPTPLSSNCSRRAPRRRHTCCQESGHPSWRGTHHRSSLHTSCRRDLWKYPYDTTRSSLSEP